LQELLQNSEDMYSAWGALRKILVGQKLLFAVYNLIFH